MKSAIPNRQARQGKHKGSQDHHRCIFETGLDYCRDHLWRAHEADKLGLE